MLSAFFFLNQQLFFLFCLRFNCFVLLHIKLKEISALLSKNCELVCIIRCYSIQKLYHKYKNTMPVKVLSECGRKILAQIHWKIEKLIETHAKWERIRVYCLIILLTLHKVYLRRRLQMYNIYISFDWYFFFLFYFVCSFLSLFGFRHSHTQWQQRVKKKENTTNTHTHTFIISYRCVCCICAIGNVNT